jgi:hypothetical protein
MTGEKRMLIWSRIWNALCEIEAAMEAGGDGCCISVSRLEEQIAKL